METMKLTESQFIDYLATIKGCNFMNVETLKEQDMLKRNNPYYGRVLRHTTCVLQFNFSYENAVNNRLEKQGDERSFNGGSLPWGHWVNGLENKVIEHKGNLYVRFYEAHNPKYMDFILDGKAMPKAELEIAYPTFRFSTSFSKKQANEGLVGNQVKPEVIKVKDIVSITINNTNVVIER